MKNLNKVQAQNSLLNLDLFNFTSRRANKDHLMNFDDFLKFIIIVHAQSFILFLTQLINIQ